MNSKERAACAALAAPPPAIELVEMSAEGEVRGKKQSCRAVKTGANVCQASRLRHALTFTSNTASAYTCFGLAETCDMFYQFLDDSSESRLVECDGVEVVWLSGAVRLTVET